MSSARSRPADAFAYATPTRGQSAKVEESGARHPTGGAMVHARTSGAVLLGTSDEATTDVRTYPRLPEAPTVRLSPTRTSSEKRGACGVIEVTSAEPVSARAAGPVSADSPVVSRRTR